jgi:stearoyl-CoA desaturase (delta-9 desaturase)
MQSCGIQRSESLAVVKVRIVIVHLASLGVFFVPATTELVVAAVIGYFVRVFAWEVGSHRYFSHRSFKTSRAFQLFLAVLAAAAGQRGPIWWAAHHRVHHRHTDKAQDPHSPVAHSFWYAHLGWLLDQKTLDTDLDAARDLAQVPELVWVNKYHYLFPYALLAGIFAAGEYTALFGSPGLGIAAAVWVFFLGTLVSLHSSFAINTLTHGRRLGWLHSRRYASDDATTNVWWLAIPTMGSSWHNNHHHYMNSARHGFYWWEIDLAYIVLRALALLRIVWELKPVPPAVLEAGRHQG